MAEQNGEFDAGLTGLRTLRLQHAHHGAAADVAYWTIRDGMRTGTIKPGQRLVELDLAAALEMSRTPIREALRRLEVERLIELAPRRGFVVPTISLDDLVEIYEIREVLEGLAARRAAHRLGPAEIDAMEAVVEQMEAAVAAADLDTLSDASHQFHQLLQAGSKQSRLPQLLSLLFDAHRSVTALQYGPGRVTEAVAEHRAIYEAIAAHDAETAERMTREHSRHALRAQILAHHLTG